MRVSVLMTCHNRREQTLACLSAVAASRLAPSCSLKVYLVDDGSTDGTSLAVRERFGDVQLIPASGDLYWNRGMHLAFRTAMLDRCDAYLWLNDDTILYRDGISRLIATWQSQAGAESCIVVGSTCAPSSGQRLPMQS